MKKICVLAVGRLKQTHQLQSSKPKDRIFKQGLKILSQTKFVTYQILKWVKKHFFYDCLLIQLFCVVYRNRWCFKTHIGISVFGPQWLQLLCLLQSINCQYTNFLHLEKCLMINGTRCVYIGNGTIHLHLLWTCLITTNTFQESFFSNWNVKQIGSCLKLFSTVKIFPIRELNLKHPAYQVSMLSTTLNRPLRVTGVNVCAQQSVSNYLQVGKKHFSKLAEFSANYHLLNDWICFSLAELVMVSTLASWLKGW